MSARKIIFGIEARQKIAKGIDILANTVKSTLGPCGRNVAIKRAYGPCVITKDGVTVAKEIHLEDPFEDMGAQMVSDVAAKTASSAGDGTTTATVLAQAIFREGNKYVTSGANPMDLKRGIDKAVAAAVASLKELAKPISNQNEIESVATISANSDVCIGKMIAEAMERVGRDGVITVEESKSMDNELDVVEGMQFDRGYISPYFVTDADKAISEFNNPVILIVDQKITSVKPLLPVLEFVSKSNLPLLIIADDVEGEALTALVINKLRGSINVCAVRSPAFGESKKECLEDIAILVDGLVVSDETGRTLDSVGVNDLGGAKKVIIKKDSCIIVEGKGSAENIKARIDLIKNRRDEATSDYDKDCQRERIAKLSGGVAVIKVGGATELEMKEKKDRVDDALHATRAAIEEGIVPGGGCALLVACAHLDLDLFEGDEKLGAQIILNAMQEPLRIIATNGGFDASVVLNTIRNSMRDKEKWCGFDAKNDRHVDMIEAGIIDPTKVVRCALQNAASIAGLLLTTEAMVHESPIDKPTIPNPMSMHR